MSNLRLGKGHLQRKIKDMQNENLVSINILSRTKEIGIRKVLGASVVRIGTLINRPFLIERKRCFVSGVFAPPINEYVAVPVVPFDNLKGVTPWEFQRSYIRVRR